MAIANAESGKASLFWQPHIMRSDEFAVVGVIALITGAPAANEPVFFWSIGVEGSNPALKAKIWPMFPADVPLKVNEEAATSVEVASFHQAAIEFVVRLTILVMAFHVPSGAEIELPDLKYTCAIIK